MAKDKKTAKPLKLLKADKPKDGKAKGDKTKKNKAKGSKSTSKAHPLEALNRLADHPLLAELLAAGALAAVAAIADAGTKDPRVIKSADSAKKAGKAAAAAIGARLLKEFTTSTAAPAKPTTSKPTTSRK